MSKRLRNPNARLQRIEKPGSHHFSTPIDEQVQEVRDVLVDLWSVTSTFHTATSSDYTTTGSVNREIVVTDSTGTGTTTISLHALPKIGAQVTVKRGGTKAVTVDTDGAETIDGAASVALATQYDAVTFEAVNDSSTDTTSVNYIITSEVVY